MRAMRHTFGTRYARQSEKVKRVVVALWMNGAAGRDILSGVFRFARASRHWNVRLLQLPNGFPPEIMAQIDRDGIDGLITSELAEHAVKDILARSPVPLVFIGPRDERFNANATAISFIGCDDRVIGAMGAKHLMSLGNFSSFAFVGTRRNVHWSDERLAGFRDVITARGKECATFHPKNEKADWYLDHSELGDWLESLPKPAAVMVAFDYYAIQVLDICRKRGIDVPRQMSVLGVDNDELLCDFSDPPLSSIHPDHERAGFLAASELDALMRRPNRKPRGLTCPVKRIVERASTRPITPAAHLVRRALAFIRSEASHGIGVMDVVRHIGVSRRLADLRFRESEHQSILGAITGERLGVAEKLLSETDYAVSRIAKQSGYRSAKALLAAFKKHHGVTPTQWRTSRG